LFLFALKPTRLGVLFAVLAGLGVGFWQWSRPPRPRVVLKGLEEQEQACFWPDNQTLAIRYFVPNEGYSMTLFDVRRIEHAGGWDISPNGQMKVVLGLRKTRWSYFTEWLGIQGEPLETVSLKNSPWGEEIIVLEDCIAPVFSRDGKNLLVTGSKDRSLQLWDLPIRKPIGKILGVAGLAAVATLLAFKGLGRRRSKKSQTTSVGIVVSATSSQAESSAG
jgi:WD40 repeat protein